MKLSEKLLIVAAWLEDSENDLIVNSDHNDDSLNIVASSLVKAASALKEGAEKLSTSELDSAISGEKLEEIAALAQAFDESGDELLMKQASVLDEILLTIAAPRNSAIDFRNAQDDRLEELKKKYVNTKARQDDLNKVSDSIKDIEKSEVYKVYRPLEAPLSTRYCPDHAGMSVIRVGEHTWQCPLDKKVFNYDAGFKLLDGSTVPGGSVDAQTPDTVEAGHAIFDTREGRLNNQQ